jgi:hypothetical protein
MYMAYIYIYTHNMKGARMMVSHFDYLWPDLKQCRNKWWSNDQKGYTGYICVVKHIFVHHKHLSLSLPSSRFPSLSLSSYLHASLSLYIYIYIYRERDLWHSNIDFRVCWVRTDIRTITKYERTFRATQYTRAGKNQQNDKHSCPPVPLHQGKL